MNIVLVVNSYNYGHQGKTIFIFGMEFAVPVFPEISGKANELVWLRLRCYLIWNVVKGISRNEIFVYDPLNFVHNPETHQPEKTLKKNGSLLRFFTPSIGQVGIHIPTLKISW